MKTIITVCLLALIWVSSSAQVGVMNVAPDASAALQVTSPGNNKGVLIPRLTEDQVDAIATPATGLLVFDFNNNVFKFYDGTDWVQMGTTSQTAAPAGIVIKDGGDLYFNTATLNMNYYNGTSWRKFVKTGTAL